MNASDRSSIENPASLQAAGRSLPNALKLLLVLCLGLTLALLTLEGLLRFLEARAITAKWSDRPNFYVRPLSNVSFPVSFHGAIKEKAQGIFRVAVVGDSISFAPHMQYDDTFSAHLDRLLNAGAEQQQAEVLNYGIPGYSTFNEINTTKQALNDKADLVILQITLNDPETEALDRKHEEHVQRFGPYVAPESLRGLFSIWHTPRFVLSRLHNTRTQKAYVKYFKDLFSDSKSLRSFRESLASIRSLTDANSAKLMAVVFPLFGHALDDSYPFMEEHQIVHRALKELDLDYLDLFDAYKQIPIDRLQVIPGADLHPNELAHRIAGENIYTFIYQRKLVPDDLRQAHYTKQRSGIREPLEARLPHKQFNQTWKIKTSDN